MQSRVKTRGKWETIEHSAKTSTGRKLTDAEKEEKRLAKEAKQASDKTKTETKDEKPNEQEKVEQK